MVQIDEPAFTKACEATNDPYATMPCERKKFIEIYCSYLPKPESPYEQAILYRKLVGME